MARFSRLDVLQRIIDQALVPVFYHPDAPVGCRVIAACAAGGSTVFEFTNRGDHAIDVFQTLIQNTRREHPSVILGAGSIVDEATAALYAAQGANFIVGPSFNPAVARFCNRRKIPYLPGCATLTEIGVAEEAGVEIVKLFPCEAAGGPGFVKAALGPTPWTRIMPTGIESVTRESLGAWIKAGAVALGLGRALFPKEALDSGNYELVTRRTAEVLGWIREARTGPKA
ncbi:MAG TPA: bifunctional 4-hydroxy-2-oxoglutarate aldolase/2-dehydro-3-deoxy-phosphogluconate aldolase [Verrucomicrobiales bacterium]|nr:bifunctional 4-hydroxy-2-oxoglutarate aldolase/2-dehydro-3-deoxy-phosphogluconate aldolase [Verrucomicrobiales bacterium]